MSTSETAAADRLPSVASRSPRALVGLALIVALSSAMPVSAQAVVVAGSIEHALAQRIRGQLADTPWELRVEPDAALETGVDAARTIAAGARAVVWVRRTGRGFEVAIADVEGRRLLVRELEGRFTESTLLETVAAWIRATLEALRMGAEIGVSPPPRPSAPERPAIGATERVDAAPVERAEAREAQRTDVPVRRGSSIVGFGSVRGEFALDEPGLLGAIAIDAGIGWERWRALLRLAAGIPATEREERFALELARYRAELTVGLDVLDDPVVALVVALHTGIELVRRATTDARAPLEPEPERWHPLWIVGGSLRLEAWLLPAFGLLVAVGVDGLPWALRWDVREGGTVSEVASLWNVRPWAALGLTWAFR